MSYMKSYTDSTETKLIYICFFTIWVWLQVWYLPEYEACIWHAMPCHQDFWLCIEAAPPVGPQLASECKLAMRPPIAGFNKKLGESYQSLLCGQWCECQTCHARLFWMQCTAWQTAYLQPPLSKFFSLSVPKPITTLTFLTLQCGRGCTQLRDASSSLHVYHNLSREHAHDFFSHQDDKAFAETLSWNAFACNAMSFVKRIVAAQSTPHQLHHNNWVTWQWVWTNVNTSNISSRCKCDDLKGHQNSNGLAS